MIGFSTSQIAWLNRPNQWTVFDFLDKPDAGPFSDVVNADGSERHTHRHAHAEILFVLSGAGNYRVDNRIYPLKPGTLIACLPNVPHDSRYHAKNATGLRLMIAVLPNHFLVYVHKGSESPRTFETLGFRIFRPNEVGVCPSALHTLWDNRAKHSPAVLRQRFLAVMLLLFAGLEAWPVRAEEADEPNFSSIRLSIQTVQEHIRAVHGHNVTLSSLAAISGYSKYHFHRIFKKHTGMTPLRFIDQCRRQRAFELLTKGWSKQSISNDLGFSNPSAYARWERHHGLRKDLTLKQ